MNEYRIELKLSDLEAGLNDIRTGMESISAKVMSDNDLWDNADIIKNWHVSQRTLASWRAKQLIDYVKVGRKIYYSKHDRDRFLNKFHIDNVR
mgnify:CR=1 FL=1